MSAIDASPVARAGLSRACRDYMTVVCPKYYRLHWMLLECGSIEENVEVSLEASGGSAFATASRSSSVAAKRGYLMDGARSSSPTMIPIPCVDHFSQRADVLEVLNTNRKLSMVTPRASRSSEIGKRPDTDGFVN